MTTARSDSPSLGRGDNALVKQEGIAGHSALVREAYVWTRQAEFRVDELAAGNARNYTHVYLSQQPSPVNIEAAAAIAHVLVSNAVAYSGSLSYGVVSLRWALLPGDELVMQVQDERRDFPGFDEGVAWEPAEGERPRGLWTARRLGAEIAYAPVDGGKVVQALIKPPVTAPA